MQPETLDYVQGLLVRLLQTPSPTGDTEDVIRLLEQEAKNLGYPTERNRKGGLLIQIPGASQQQHRLITAHVDTLGAMVKEVLDEGTLRLSRIGGFAWNTIEGEYCGVKTQAGEVISGTILLHNTSIHVNQEVGKSERRDDNIEVVLDAKVNSKADVRQLGVEVGDFVFFDPRVQETPTGFIKSRHLDDKASVAIVFGALRELAEDVAAGRTLPYTVNILISNNEEIGYGGNSNIPAETVEYLAIDMGAIGEGQTTTEYCVSICAKDASGPYHLGLRRHLTRLAEEHRLDYTVDIYPYYGSDASAAIRSGADIVHGLIGPGVANSHAYERTHQSALQNTLSLLLAYLYSPLAPIR